MPFVKSWILVISVVLLLGCSGAADEVSLSFLVEHSTAYSGRNLVVEGQVRGLEEPEHYWLEDSDMNRIGLKPDHRAKTYLDQQVRVTGLFQASPDKGRWLRIKALEPLP
ncbi:hypothetical protein [Marinospirillum sp.]|uniref:hypothetical protein n=1 Tax=Marinospirillum sp. TaxID=2183934 RepID=UPI00384F3A34